MTEPRENNQMSEPNEGYEKRDVSANKVIFVGVMGILLLVVMVVAMIDYFTVFTEEQIYETVLKPESSTLRELRAREAEALHSYKLLDATGGVYQIPVERAIDLMADAAFQERISQSSEKTGSK